MNSESARIELLSGDAWAPRFIMALRQARQEVLGSVYMISPNWGRKSPLRLNLVNELAAIAARGLTARMVIGTPIQVADRARFNLRAARQLREAGWGIRVIGPPKVLHEKIWLIDRRLVIIGSHNISISSATRNLDTSVLIECEATAAKVLAQIESRWCMATEMRDKDEPNGNDQKHHHPTLTSRTSRRPTARNGRRII